MTGCVWHQHLRKKPLAPSCKFIASQYASHHSKNFIYRLIGQLDVDFSFARERDWDEFCRKRADCIPICNQHLTLILVSSDILVHEIMTAREPSHSHVIIPHHWPAHSTSSCSYHTINSVACCRLQDKLPAAFGNFPLPIIPACIWFPLDINCVDRYSTKLLHAICLQSALTSVTMISSYDVSHCVVHC